MANIGNAYINIIPKAPGIKANVEKALNGASGAGVGLGKSIGTKLIAGLGAVGVGAAATKMISSSIRTGMDFDAAISQVAATLGKSAAEVADLREFALSAGTELGFSAQQSAEALNYMALAGYNAEDSMATLPSVLSLAAAGNIDLAYASDMVTDAQSALGLELQQVTDMVNQMAKASSKSNTSVAQLGEAILTVGGTAQYMAGGTENLTKVLGVMADNGIKGSEAGTHLRNLLLSLSSPSAGAKKVLEQLGVQIFDDAGKMRDFAEVFPELSAAMAGMTDQEKLDAFSQLFNARDIASATALLNTSTDRWKELGDAIVDSDEAAEIMAKTQLDNLAGDVKKLRFAFDETKIAVSDALSPALRRLAGIGSTALAGITDGLKSGKGLGAVLGEVGRSAVTSLAGAVPKMLDAGRGWIDGLKEGLAGRVSTLMSSALPMIQTFTAGLREKAGALVDSGISMVKELVAGFVQGMPAFFQNVPLIVSNIAGIINDNVPKLLAAGASIIKQIVVGLWQNRGVILENAGNIVRAIWDVITAINWISLGGKIVTGLVNGVKALFHSLPNAMKSLARNGINAFKAIDWAGLGRDLVMGIIRGLKNAAGSLFTAVGDLVRNTLKRGQDEAEVGSPSRLFARELGQWIPPGIAQGVDQTAASLDRAVQNTIRGAAARPAATAATAGEIASLLNSTGDRPVNVQVVLQGDARELFKLVDVRNATRTKATGYNALARRTANG